MNLRTVRRPVGPGTVRFLVRAAALVILVVADAAAATYSVPGFSDTAVIPGLTQPTDFAFLPDGRILIVERAGRVLLAGPGGGPTTVALDMTAIVEDNASERGLLGICPHPDFASTGHIYLYFTTTDGTTRNRISRFTMTGNTISLASQSIILDHISSENGNHNGGTILIGPDGKLWAAPGDSGTGGAKAQILDAASPSRFSGKVLRMELDGSPAAGNPFLADPSKEPRIWAYGLRNPFRFSFRPSNGKIYIGDVGQSAREEVDVGVIGGNFGWPYFEGTLQHSACPVTTTCLPPVYEYPRTVGTTITGGVFVTGNAYPLLKDKYVFGDSGQGWIKFLEFNASDQVVGVLQDLATSAGGPVAFHQGPDGSLYYSAYGFAAGTGNIYRIDYGRDFHTVAPCRVVDTRDPPGSVGGPRLVAGADRTFVISGRCGIPAAARAIAANLTVTEPTDHGHLTIFPAGGAPPLSSVINFRPDSTRANNAVLVLGPAGDLVVRCSMATGGTHFVLDVTGYTE